jgi:oligosaccharide repeat unit polymerase
VPLFRDFDLGVGYLYAFFTIIPNLFWEIHPTIAHGLAAHWLVQTVAPASAALGRGYGFSFIAEAYLNFGWIGAPIVLGFIGFLLARLVLWAQRKYEPAKMATVASFLAFFLIYARGESGSIVRPLFWYALLPYFLVHFMSHSRKARPKASSPVTRNET